MRTLTRLWIRLDWRARTSLRQRSTSNTACRNLTSSQSLGRKVCSSMQRDVGSVCTRYLVWKNGTHCVNAFLTGLFYPHRTHQFQGQACRGLQEEPHRDGWAWDKTCQGEQHNTAPCCIRLGMSLWFGMKCGGLALLKGNQLNMGTCILCLCVEEVH